MREKCSHNRQGQDNIYLTPYICITAIILARDEELLHSRVKFT